MNTIKLKSRYGNTYNLIEVETLVKYKLDEKLDYLRMGHNNDNTDSIAFIDPPGGPFMQVNEFVTDAGTLRKIECIKGEGIFLTFEK